MNMYVKHSFAMDECEIESIIISYINEPKNFYKNNMIKRYVKFIFACKNKNKKDRSIIHIESHHILPKSLFPEYASFIECPWNKAQLPLRHHFIAHIMLHHIFGGKMSYALSRMVKNKNSKLYEQSKLSYLTSNEFIKNSKKGGCITKSLIAAGLRIYYKNGISIGWMHKDDPRIITDNLSIYKETPLRIKQTKEWGKNTSIGNIGRSYYNNGNIQLKLKDNIPNGFIKGGLRKYSKSDVLNALLNDNVQNDMIRTIRFFKINVNHYKPLYERCLLDISIRNKLLIDIVSYKDIADILDIDLCDCYMLYMDRHLLLSLIENNLLHELCMNKRELNKLFYKYNIEYTNKKIHKNIPDNFCSRIIPLLLEYKGITKEVSDALCISISHIQRLCEHYNIDYRLYWDMNKRYKVDTYFSNSLYHAFNGDIEALADILDISIKTCRKHYKK